jgi:HD-GYP domain-containing protein (c-di-GMP phosphodiesterase class II)
LVDNQWQVRSGDPAAPQASYLHWSTSPMAPDRNTAAMGPLCFHGILQLPDGPALAAAAPVPSLNGYIVAYRSVDQLSINPLSATLPLLCACLIAFVGTMSLFGLGGYLILARIHERFSERWSELQTVALRRAEGLVRSRDAIVFGLADLTESRDPETGNHLQRLAMYASTLTMALRQHDKFRDLISHEFVDVLRQSALLHDIGKVAVEDAILLKPGPLTPQERLQMQQHATVGEHCLRRIEQQLGPTKFIHTAREIAHSHHERWDGRGYPQGLSGEQIPLSARIVAVCDVYDALSCRRVYKEPWPHDDCVAYIGKEAGKHFDPDIVETFLQIHQQFRAIAQQYATAESRGSGRNNEVARRNGRDDQTPRDGSIAPPGTPLKLVT